MTVHSINRPLEKDVQRAIMKWLRARPMSFTAKMAAGPYSTPGVPDILHIERGVSYLFEVKRVGEKPRPLQEVTIGKLNQAGACASVVYSLDEVKQVIEWKAKEK